MDLVITHPNLYLKGGAELVLLKIAQKYNAKIYTYNYRPENTWADFKDLDVNVIKNYDMNSLFMLKTCKGFYRYKIKDNYDVINAHWSPSNWIRNRNERVVWYCHSPARAFYDLYEQRQKEYSLPVRWGHAAFADIYRSIDKKINSQIEKICCNSLNVQHRIRTYFDRESEVISPGVDLNDFESLDYQRYFFYPSRITPSKRIEFAIEAFNLLNKKYPHFQLVIAGGLQEKDRPYLEKIQKICPTKIMINVSEEKMKELYANCYAVLFSGMDEDFGITPLEAMASFKPIISVNEGGPRETIIDGETGYLVNSITEMAQKMSYLIEHFDEVERLGNNGRKRVRENYTWNIFLDKFDAALKEVSKK
ncbi:MAG: glycosyltransferase [Candidatus Woesearchaeota archaeon]